MTITLENAKDILEYHPDSGDIVWKVDNGRRVKSGHIAGSVDKGHGYRVVRYQGKAFLAHRLAWFLYYGRWPKNMIDHINGNKTDNRIKNLRDVTRSINRRNTFKTRAGRLTGCDFHKQMKKWRARIIVNGQEQSLGLFPTEIEAHNAFLQAYEKHFGPFPGVSI